MVVRDNWIFLVSSGGFFLGWNPEVTQGSRGPVAQGPKFPDFLAFLKFFLVYLVSRIEWVTIPHCSPGSLVLGDYQLSTTSTSTSTSNFKPDWIPNSLTCVQSRCGVAFPGCDLSIIATTKVISSFFRIFRFLTCQFSNLTLWTYQNLPKKFNYIADHHWSAPLSFSSRKF